MTSIPRHRDKSGRVSIPFCHLHLLAFLAIACVVSDRAAHAQELFADPRFERGFALTGDSALAKTPEIGTLQTGPAPASEPPFWRLAQWASRYLIQPGVCTFEDGAWQARTPGKRVCIERPKDGPVSLLLEVFGGVEYENHLRVYGAAWPHLLIEQRYETPIRPSAFVRLDLHFGMRIVRSAVAAGVQEKLDPSLHTAQTTAYWTVHNLTPGSPDFQDMIWFGIPLFDARYEVPGASFAIDAGQAAATGKYICVLDGKRFWKGATGDGQWRTLDTDLKPLLQEALDISRRHGVLQHTQFEDLGITTFNLGWEMPGPYDAALEVRGLSLKGETK